MSVIVKNTGPVHGAEVAQLYLGFPPSAGEPPQVLRGFQKLHLAPGAEATATFNLGAGVSGFQTHALSFKVPNKPSLPPRKLIR